MSKKESLDPGEAERAFRKATDAWPPEDKPGTCGGCTLCAVRGLVAFARWSLT